MIKFLTKHTKELSIVGALSVLIICFFQQRELTKLRLEVKVQRNTADSLHAELLPIQIELGRYRVAYEIFVERNPRAAEQYGAIISEETE